jgi:hypothetical protein
MTATPDYRSAAYLIIVLGCLAAWAASVVPFYGVGYKLNGLVLSAVLTPFVVYGIFIEDLRGPWLLAAGLVLLGAMLSLVIDERFLNYTGYHDDAIYWVPLVTVAIVEPIAYVFGKRDPYS